MHGAKAVLTALPRSLLHAPCSMLQAGSNDWHNKGETHGKAALLKDLLEILRTTHAMLTRPTDAARVMSGKHASTLGCSSTCGSSKLQPGVQAKHLALLLDCSMLAPVGG